MQKILLNFQRKILAQSLIEVMKNDGRFEFYPEYVSENIPIAVQKYGVDIALIEIPETGENPAENCLKLCCDIRKGSPRCKLFLICPENNEFGKKIIVQAKQQGQIEDFVFYDSSLDYLIHKLESMK